MPDKITITCPECHSLLESDRKGLGNRATCPNCHKAFIVTETELEVDFFYYIAQSAFQLLYWIAGVAVLFAIHSMIHPHLKNGGRDVGAIIEAAILTAILALPALHHVLEFREKGRVRAEESKDSHQTKLTIYQEYYRYGLACLMFGFGSICLIAVSAALTAATDRELPKKDPTDQVTENH